MAPELPIRWGIASDAALSTRYVALSAWYCPASNSFHLVASDRRFRGGNWPIAAFS